MNSGKGLILKHFTPKAIMNNFLFEFIIHHDSIMNKYYKHNLTQLILSETKYGVTLLFKSFIQHSTESII